MVFPDNPGRGLPTENGPVRSVVWVFSPDVLSGLGFRPVRITEPKIGITIVICTHLYYCTIVNLDYGPDQNNSNRSYCDQVHIFGPVREGPENSVCGNLTFKNRN